MKVLLIETYPEGKPFGAIPDLWKLASTITESPPEKHEWWSNSKCGLCDLTASFFQRDIGYRCEMHPPTIPGSPSAVESQAA